MPVVLLPDRNVVSVAGADARHFLQGLLTCDMAKVGPDTPGFGALLTPQGKIMFDFLVYEDEGRFLLDAPREKAAELIKRLSMYKLRAKVEIADLSAESAGAEALSVTAIFGEAPTPPDGALLFCDPRENYLGWRALMPVSKARGYANALPAVYDAHRIARGVPKGGLDFVYGDAFPHDANMDKLHGVAFDKGCYVGQEVVSRMQHRGLARKRIVKVDVEGETAPGVEIRAGAIAIGTMGAAIGGHGLAMVRLDRAEEAKGEPMTAGEARVSMV